MALDKSIVKRIAIQTGMPTYLIEQDNLQGFAKAIYALGVANERENNAKLCESFKVAIGNDEVVVAMHTAYDDCAEAIRKGE